jgi:hypothetical protein
MSDLGEPATVIWFSTPEPDAELGRPCNSTHGGMHGASGVGVVRAFLAFRIDRSLHGPLSAEIDIARGSLRAIHKLPKVAYSCFLDD